MKKILLIFLCFFVFPKTQAAIYPKELIAKTIGKANKQIGLKPITV
ncbi:MAG: hypothetical protein RIS68_1034, partial [Bacteroidota bacterium]